MVFAGAIIGTLFGSKGSLFIREKGTAPYYFKKGTGEQMPLGFALRVNDFTLTYYDTGMPKEFRSDLTVIDGGREVLHKSIVVNDPLDYKGYTFYQASYQAEDDYWITVQNQNTGARDIFLATPGRELKWHSAL